MSEIGEGVDIRRVIAMGCGVAVLAAAAWFLGTDERPAGMRKSRLARVSAPVAQREVAGPQAPHVVLIIGCTVRRDQVGVYGGREDVTPHLDRGSAAGTVFEDLIAAAPWTKPASLAILTGHHAVGVSMVEPKRRRNDRVLPSDVTLASEWLGRAGWYTVGVSTNPNLHEVFGFHRGFDDYAQPGKLWRDGGAKVAGASAVAEVLKYLDERDSQEAPVYLQAMLIDAHAPYARADSDSSHWVDESEPSLLGEYRAGLHRFDLAVGRLVEGLADRGLDESNTVFFVVSDHGEGLSYPRHHGKSHGRFLTPSTVEGVWMAWGVGISEGATIDGVASQVDVLPTLLSLAGVEGYTGPGLSHADLLAGGGGTTRRTHAYTDTWFLEVSRSAVYTREYACQKSFGADEKGLFEAGCFDRNLDPMHSNNLGLLPLLDQLDAWRAQQERDGKVGLGASIAPVDSSLQGQLEALGYLERPPPTGEKAAGEGFP